MDVRRAYRLIIVALAISLAACGEEIDESTYDDPTFETTEQALISSYYDAGSRSIYAPARLFRGTPNVKITTRSALTGRCAYTGPVVMRRLAGGSATRTICSGINAGFRRVVVSGGVEYGDCIRLQTNTVEAVMYYNYTSATQRQLNYNVFDWDGARALDSSGWQPAGGNGCERAIP